MPPSAVGAMPNHQENPHTPLWLPARLHHRPNAPQAVKTLREGRMPTWWLRSRQPLSQALTLLLLGNRLTGISATQGRINSRQAAPCGGPVSAEGTARSPRKSRGSQGRSGPQHAGMQAAVTHSAGQPKTAMRNLGRNVIFRRRIFRARLRHRFSGHRQLVASPISPKMKQGVTGKEGVALALVVTPEFLSSEFLARKMDRSKRCYKEAAQPGSSHLLGRFWQQRGEA